MILFKEFTNHIDYLPSSMFAMIYNTLAVIYNIYLSFEVGSRVTSLTLYF